MARWQRSITIVVGLAFVAPGLWAMVDPRSFFELAAAFEPYNQHFIQDIGAFQIGLGAVLLLAASTARSASTVALLGVGIGSAAHTVSHIIGRDLGGRPEFDITAVAAIALVLLGLGAWRWRQERTVR